MFKNKVVAITGATGGIGSATAKAFADAGACLAVSSTRQEKLDALKANLALPEDRFFGKVINVAVEDEVAAFINETVEHYGRIDVMVNNAGYEGDSSSIADIKYEDFKKVIDINLYGALFGTKHAFRHMKEQQSGAIICVSSEGGFNGGPGMAAYTCSKHAINGLIKCAATEAIHYNVFVNGVAPGPVDNHMMRELESKMGKGMDPAEMKKMLESTIPQGRYAKSEEIADSILFLASQKASHIVGQILRIDGGSSC